MAILATEEKKNTAVTAEPKATEAESSTTTTTTQPAQSGTNQKLYNDTMETLKTVENSPPNFTSSYDDQITEIYNKIVNREPFKYEAASDPLYNQYKESYTQQGKQAMKDTMGQAAALTGGYGSSYGQAVGQQQYDAYLQRLNDVLPDLYGAAYDKWADEGAQLRSDLSLASALRDTEYGQYRDKVGDQQYADAWALQQAESRAQYGDFGGYAALYGEEEANKMRLTWAASNPDAAYTAGTITADEYYMLTGVEPRQPLSAMGAASGGNEVNYYNLGGNQDVIEAQKVLRNQGYNISVDGVWGPETTAAATAASGGKVTKLEDMYEKE